VLEGDGEVLLVDQHAAHERITYARLREGYASGAVPGQRLLFPVTVPLQADEEEALREQAPLVARLGFEVELLSGRTGAIRAVPAPLAGADPARLVRDVAAELAHGPRSDTLERGLDHLAATLACHGSVRGGAPLSRPEVEALLRDLDRVERSGHCPHGRPVLVRLSDREIRRRFGRE
jgi:DNA mismatch repair protein MutL